MSGTTITVSPVGGVLVPPNGSVTVTNASDLATALAAMFPPGTYAAAVTRESYTYNADGTVHTVTDTGTGAVTTYTYNADGTVHTAARVLSGVTTTLTYAYNADGTIASVT